MKHLSIEALWYDFGRVIGSLYHADHKEAASKLEALVRYLDVHAPAHAANLANLTTDMAEWAVKSNWPELAELLTTLSRDIRVLFRLYPYLNN